MLVPCSSGSACICLHRVLNYTLSLAGLAPPNEVLYVPVFLDVFAPLYDDNSSALAGGYASAPALMCDYLSPCPTPNWPSGERDAFSLFQTFFFEGNRLPTQYGGLVPPPDQSAFMLAQGGVDGPFNSTETSVFGLPEVRL